ncbi:hypothetical protein CFC21_010254 [Triticum aestivum]|uniref:Pentacotripeptide-repeat region of PRORP domain-containing protein n=2 Tax=Triticum aestivum TaxID=4565 RepID=A0A9R1DJN0_WHEAT|nr:hypothetical protein CFC21_010254 [Triticum aestivum]
MIDLFNSMKSNGIEATCHVFNILIGAYAKCGVMDEAMLTFTEMRRQGVSPDVFTYATVIVSLCRTSRLANAIDKFDEMIAMGVQPNRPVYQSLIQGYCIIGDAVKAKELVSEMMNKVIPRPDIAFFTSIINSLCKERRVMDAQVIFDLVIM